MAEYGLARLNASALFDHRCEDFRNATQARTVEGIHALVRVGFFHAGQFEAFGHHDQRGAASRLDRFHPDTNLFDGLRLLWDENGVCATGHTRMQGNPAHVPTHHLEHHAAAVRVGGSAQTVDCLGGNFHGGVEAEGVIRGGEVVVDGLRHPDDAQAVVGQPAGGRERAFAADGDHRVDTVRIQHLLDVLRAALVTLVRVGPGRAQNGAALLGQTANVVPGERVNVPFDQSAPAVVDANEFVVVVNDTLQNGAANHGVQSGAVATTGEQSNSHCV